MFDELQLLSYFVRAKGVDARVEIKDVAQFAAGLNSNVYAFTLQYLAGFDLIEERLVMKTYTPDIDGKDHALREYHGLDRLRAAGYAVPRPTLVEIDDYHIGQPFLVMTHVDGEPLWDVFQKADSDERAGLTRLFVRLLVELQEVRPRIVVPRMKVPSPLTLVNREMLHLRQNVQKNKLDVLQPIVDWLDERRKTVPCTRPVISHRDFHPWNVLLTGDDEGVVIDWNWQIGDGRYDLAWAVTMMRRIGEHDFANAVLNEYENQTAAPIEQFGFFEVLTSMNWMITVLHSAQTGSNLRSNGKSAFKLLIAEWVKAAIDLISTRTGIPIQLAL